jgi:hypothetical protein
MTETAIVLGYDTFLFSPFAYAVALRPAARTEVRTVVPKDMWEEVSMCDTPPTLIIVHVDLVQHFVEDTVLQLTTGHW